MLAEELWAGLEKNTSELLVTLVGLVAIIVMIWKRHIIRNYLSEIKENRAFILYLGFVIVIMIISFFLSVVYKSFPPEEQDVENARYLLSAVIQSLAAILAIVVTITFVSVQLASQTYSSRVTKIFTHSNNFWRLFAVFSSSILASLLLLTFLKTEDAYFGSFAGIALTAGCLLMLGDYIRGIPKLLSLEFFLQESFKKIDRKFFEYIRKNAKPEEESIEPDIPESRDPFLLYFDILINATKRKDLATIRSSNLILQRDVRHKIAAGVINGDNEKIVSIYYLDHLEKILDIELESRDVAAVEYSYETLEYIGKAACGDGLKEFLKRICGVISFNEILNLEKSNPPNVSAINVLDSLLMCLITGGYSDNLVHSYLNAIFNIAYEAGERKYYYFPHEGILRLEKMKSELSKENFPRSLEGIDQFLEELKELEKRDLSP